MDVVWPGVLARYRAHLPVSEATPCLTLGEGGTPLVEAVNIPRRRRWAFRLFLKCEFANPTGSFKDRGMVMAMAKAVEAGARAVVCASTGNTAASAAAYAARAGLPCLVLLPSGGVAAGKLAQALLHGARVLAVDGSFDAALLLARRLSASYPLALVNSVNPHRLQGQKTAAFEVCDALGGNPDFLCLPVGNAGNIVSYWMGSTEYRRAGRIDGLPVLIGVQAAGASSLVSGRPVERPETVASAIRIGLPASWDGAVAACRESGGRFLAVTDGEILAAQQELAAWEGAGCEPASAASLAGLIKVAEEGGIPAGSRVVCVLTGHALKDPEVAARSGRVEPVPASPGALEEMIVALLSAGGQPVGGRLGTDQQGGKG
ncbi:MAG: threonine synthase [bacterium]|nr:threonine synthase [bacterium]